MAQWSDTTEHSASSFNGGNQYTTDDQMSIEALNNNIENALYAVRLAKNTNVGANNPVSYNSQIPTSAEQNQAQKNIGVDRLFVEQGVADINDCSTYDELYNALSNSPNGTGIGNIGVTASTSIKTLLPALPFNSNFVNVYAKITAGNDSNAWVIELSTIDLYSNGQTIPTYNLQIGKNIVDGVATYRVTPWYNPATTILSASIGQNGYIKYTNGLIIQWGRFTSSGGGIPVTFPIAFTSSVFAIAGSNIAATNTDTTSTIKASNVTTAGATFYAPYRGSGSSAGFTDSTSETFTWIAIGE